jgi:hypothetical protein
MLDKNLYRLKININLNQGGDGNTDQQAMFSKVVTETLISRRCSAQEPLES